MADSLLDPALARDLVAWRRHLHAHPELSFQEFATAAFVANRLREFGLAPRTGIARTGVIATLGSGRPCVLVRADMDALPIQEQNEVEYRSQNPGAMHACGHDGHTAMLLTLARLFATETLPGTVKFMFQPAEEAYGGALPMIEAGLLDDPPVDAAFACHLWNNLEIGTIGVRAGAMMAATDELAIVVTGKGGHGAAPHQTVDPIVTACQIVTALQTVISRSVDPLASAVVTIGTIHGGEAPNIIPERVELRGTIRSLDPEVRETVLRRVRETVEGVAAAMGAQVELHMAPGYPVTVNDPAWVEVVREAAASVVGRENVVELPPTMGGEDMGFVLQRVPGCYFAVGSRNEARGLAYPHHHPRFDFDEDALAIGVATMARVVRLALRRLAG